MPMMEFDSKPSSSDQPVTFHNRRSSEMGRRPRSSRKLTQSTPCHYDDSVTKLPTVEGRPHGKKVHRDTNKRSSSQRIQDTLPGEESQQPKPSPASTAQALNEQATSGSTVKSPTRVSTKSCPKNYDNIDHVHQTTSTKKLSQNEKKNSRRCHDNACDEETIIFEPSYELSSPSRSKLHHSPDSKLVAVSTIDSFGDSNATKTHINTNGTRGHVVAVREHKSSRTRKHKTNQSKTLDSKQEQRSPRQSSSMTRRDGALTKSNSRRAGDETLDSKQEQQSPRQSSSMTHRDGALTKSNSRRAGDETLDSKQEQRSPRQSSSMTHRDEALTKSNSRRADDDDDDDVHVDDDKENSQKVVSMEVAHGENKVMRRDQREKPAIQSRSDTTRKIKSPMENKGSLQESDGAVPCRELRQESKRKQRHSSTSPSKVNSSKERRRGGSVEDRTLSAVTSSTPVQDIASSIIPNVPKDLTAPKSPTSKTKHNHKHRNHTQGRERKSTTNKSVTTSTKAREVNREQGGRGSSRDPTGSGETGEASKPLDVESLHQAKAKKVDNSKDTDRSLTVSSIVDHPSDKEHATVDMHSSNTRHGKENNKARVPNHDENPMLGRRSSGKQAARKDAGPSISKSFQEANKLNREQLVSKEPSKPCQNVHKGKGTSRSVRLADEQPSYSHIIKQKEEVNGEDGLSMQASGTCVDNKDNNDTRPDLHISCNLTYADSGKGSSDEPSSSQNTKSRSLGMFPRMLLIPRTMRRRNQELKSRRLLLQASRSLSNRSTKLLSLRQFEDDDLLDDENPSHRFRLAKAKSESLIGKEDPWFHNPSGRNDSIASSMEMVFFISENDDQQEQAKD